MSICPQLLELSCAQTNNEHTNKMITVLFDVVWDNELLNTLDSRHNT